MARQRCDSLRAFFTITKLPHKKIAEATGVSQAYITMLTNGKRRPSPQLARRLEKITGVPLQRLLFPGEHQVTE